MKLMKKFKIGMISGLCTTALMASTVLATSCSTTTTNKTDKKVGLTNTPDNSVYRTITFKANDATETLTGKLVVQARDGNKWSSVRKPVATKADYKFDHWQYMNGSTPTPLEDGTEVTGNWTVTPVFVPIVHPFFVVGGNTNVPATAGVAGSDTLPWRLIKEDGTDVPLADVTFTLVKSVSTDPDLPAWLGIDDGAHGHTKGTVWWTVSVAQLTTPPKFRVNALYNGENYLSDVITLNVTPAPETPFIIWGDDVVDATKPTTYVAYEYPVVDPEEPVEVEGVSWELEWDGEGETDPTIDADTGELTTYTDTEGVATITATSSTGGFVVSKDVTIKQPYIDSNQYWTKVQTGTNPEVWSWAYYDSSRLFDGTSAIRITPLNGEPYTDDPRSSFSREIYIGTDVTYIQDNFLSACYNFNQPVIFGGTEAKPSKCIQIGDNFIASDPFALPDPETPMKFNQTLTLADSIVTIGDDFLANCTTFNNGAAAATVGFHMPDNLEEIGDEFLLQCRAFNRSIEISSKVDTIGNEFMQNCDAMQSTLTVNTAATNFATDSSEPLSFATDGGESAKCYNPGITIAGSGADVLISIFGALDGEDGNWRNIHLA